MKKFIIIALVLMPFIIAAGTQEIIERRSQLYPYVKTIYAYTADGTKDSVYTNYLTFGNTEMIDQRYYSKAAIAVKATCSTGDTLRAIQITYEQLVGEIIVANKDTIVANYNITDRASDLYNTVYYDTLLIDNLTSHLRFKVEFPDTNWIKTYSVSGYQIDAEDSVKIELNVLFKE